MRTVNILGTEYRIETHKISEDKVLKDNSYAGYCSEENKLIVIADMSEKKYIKLGEEEQKTYRKKTIRHEIVHAYLNESGLSGNASQPDGSWALNEEMIDWFAIQSPKIFKTYQELDVL